METGNIVRCRNGTATAINATVTATNDTDTDWVCLDSSMDDATTNGPLLIDKDITSAIRNGASIIEGPTRLDQQTDLKATTSSTARAATASDLEAGAAASSSANGAGGGLSGGITNSMASASSTAYAFTGSALASRTIANLNGISAGFNGGTNTASTTTTTNNNNNNNNNISNNVMFPGFGSSSDGNGRGASGINSDGDDTENRTDDSLYECNICLDTAKDAVVSMCGHLFCWPCLHQWLETRPNRKLCPVCKAAVDKDKVIPLYGRNSVNQEDPRNKVPPRPAGQRTEPEPQPGFAGFGFGDGFHMSFGIGAFPFGFFTSSLNFEPRPPAATRGTTQFQDEQALSKLFLYLAFMCIAWLLFA